MAMTSDEKSEIPREFGGAPGAGIFIILSHALLLYLWIAWRFHDGAIFYPAGISDLGRSSRETGT